MTQARRSSRKSTLPTRLAAFVVLGVALVVLGFGLRNIFVEAPEIGAQALAQIAFDGRVVAAPERAEMKQQLARAADMAPTRRRVEWAAAAFHSEQAGIAEADEAFVTAFLYRNLARSPSAHIGWMHLANLKLREGAYDESANAVAMALATGAFLPKSTRWNLAMGQRSWLYLEEDARERLNALTRDLVALSPAYIAALTKEEWQQLYVKHALTDDAAALARFEHYLKLFYDPAYNRG